MLFLNRKYYHQSKLEAKHEIIFSVGRNKYLHFHRRRCNSKWKKQSPKALIASVKGSDVH
jgi:hypothetical protein